MEIKTEEYMGNVYQIGEAYLFSDHLDAPDAEWRLGRLVGFHVKDRCPFRTRGGLCYNYIKAIPSVGTVTPAPVDLIHCNAYMFDYNDGSSYSGIYDADSLRFYFVRGHVTVSSCTNIREMTVKKRD